MVGRWSFLSIFDIWDRTIQRQFEGSEWVAAPGIHLGGPILLPGDWVDTFRSLQYGGKMLILIHLWYWPTRWNFGCLANCRTWIWLGLACNGQWLMSSYLFHHFLSLFHQNWKEAQKVSQTLEILHCANSVDGKEVPCSIFLFYWKMIMDGKNLWRTHYSIWENVRIFRRFTWIHICFEERKKKEQIQIYISPHKRKEIFLERQISKYSFAFLQTE